MYVDPSGLMAEEEIKEVISLYNNNKIAPMAYTYSMELVYNWYLAETDEERQTIDNNFYAFVEASYLTTNGTNSYVDRKIEYMPSKPESDINEKQHYFRNELNIQFEWEEFQTL